MSVREWITSPPLPQTILDLLDINYLPTAILWVPKGQNFFFLFCPR